MNVKIIKPYGYCLGVKRVLDLVNDIVIKHQDKKIYCIGQIVHNKIVNQKLIDLNIEILNFSDKEKAIEKIDSGVVIFSAHGTSKKIIEKAKKKGLIVYDVVCPFVLKEFNIIEDKINHGFDVIYIGKKNHEESTAALAISNNIHFIEKVKDVSGLKITNSKIVIINQTTLSINDLKEIYLSIQEKYPNALIIDEICNATRVRQEQVLKINQQHDVIVVGDNNSNNSKSLYELAFKKAHSCIMVEQYSEELKKWCETKKNVLIVSGTSTPNEIVENIYNMIKSI